MSDKLDKPLDELIKEEKDKKKKSFPKKKGPGGFKKDRREGKRFSSGKRGDFSRGGNRARKGDRGFVSGRDKGRKIRVLNLDYNILESDVKDLFASVGKLKFCKILWDRQGRSLGKALVKYEYDSDHAKAIREFNGAELDGRVLTVEYDN